jgi:hypothetical protein
MTVLTIKLSEGAWQQLQTHCEFADLNENEFIEQFLRSLPQPEGDDFQNLVALANVMAHAIAQRKFGNFQMMLEGLWGTCDRLNSVAEELEEELVEG